MVCIVYVNVFIILPHILYSRNIICYYFHFVNKCLLNSRWMLILLILLYILPPGLHIPIQTVPMTSWPRCVHHISEFIFPLISTSRTTWPPVRLSVFWSGFLDFPRRKAGDAAAPSDGEQLCICGLSAKTYLAVAPPAFMVWITITLTFS